MLSVIIGVVSGVLAGMGLGGGSLLIPALTLFLHIGQKVAQTANIIGFIPAAVVSVIMHAKNKLVDFKSVFVVAIAGVTVAVITSNIANNLDDAVLKKVFGGFLIAAGILEIFKNKLIKSKNV